MIFLIDMGSGLFMPFYFSYPYRFNYDFLKNYFYPFGLSRNRKTTAERIGKAFLKSAGSFNSSAFSAYAQPDFFTKGSTADFEKALDNVNREAQKSAYERYFTEVSKNFSQSNKISDILKTNDYQKSYLYSNREAFEKNFAQSLAGNPKEKPAENLSKNLVGNLAKNLYKSDFTSLIGSKKTIFSNPMTQVTECTNGLTQIEKLTNVLPRITEFTSRQAKITKLSNGLTQITKFSNPLTQITEFTNGLTKITDFSNPAKAVNLVYSGQLKIINSVLQSRSENPAFLKAYKSALSTVSTLEKSPKFGITGGFSKSEHVNIFPNFKAENTPYKSTENFAAKAAENQSGILKRLSLQEKNFYLYGKSGNKIFQSLENKAGKILGLVPLKFSRKSSEASLVTGEQIPFKKPCQATPEKSLTSAGIDLDSLLDMICSALEEELNTCAEGVHL